MSFRDDQIAQLAASGWSTCGSVAQAVAGAGLPAITAKYLGTAITAPPGAAHRVAPTSD